MSEKWCPAGGIECDRFKDEWAGEPSTTCLGKGNIGIILFPEFEQCPWPSRQQPVGKTIGYPGPDDDPLVQAHKDGYDKGRSDALDDVFSGLKALDQFKSIIPWDEIAGVLNALRKRG